MFQETQDQENFQARYVVQHPWKGSPEACPQARSYFGQLASRRMRDAQNLADLTGWNLDDVIKKAGLASGGRPSPWWSSIWD